MESKNFRNQKFTEKDINKNKAKVLCDRYFKLGINISYLDEFIENEEQMYSILKAMKHQPILLGCVDNNVARKYMNLAYMKYDKAITYIDTGNGDKIRKGQTIMGMKHHNGTTRYKCVAELFPEILEAEPEEEVEFKCSQIQEHPQNFATNNMSASVVFTMLSNLVSLNITTPHFVTFKTDKVSVQSTYNRHYT